MLQKKPALHGICVADDEPEGQWKPALQKEGEPTPLGQYEPGVHVTCVAVDEPDGQ